MAPEDRSPASPPPTGQSAEAGTKSTPSWVTEEPFPTSPATSPSSKVAVDPTLQAEAEQSSGRPAPRSSRTSTSTATATRVASSTTAPATDGNDGPSAGRRYFGLPWWGWLLVAATGLVLIALAADLRNRDRFMIVCNARKVELYQGRRLPFPFGREPVGGPAYKPIAIPAEADCRQQVFNSEEDASRAFLDILLAQVQNALANPGGANLKEARQQVQQALLLSRAQRGRRKEAESMLAELSYREGRAGLARAENELRVALSRFQEAQKLDAHRFEDLEEWIAHLEEILRSISPTPFSSMGTKPALIPPGPGPASRPAGQRAPTSMPAPSTFTPTLPPQHPDAGPPPTGGGVLM